MKYTLLLVLIFGFIACTPTQDMIENNPAELTDKQWQVKKIVDGTATTTNTNEGVAITFSGESRFRAVLEVNSCMGNYKATAASISITLDGCTEKCCDTDFDKLLQNVLGQVNTYILKENQLRLKSETQEIHLEKI